MGGKISRRTITPPAQLYTVERTFLTALIAHKFHIHGSYMTCAGTLSKALWLLTWLLPDT